MSKKFVSKKMVTLGVVTALLGVGAPSLVAPSVVEAKVDFQGTFDFEPHRGGRDARPENTLYSYTYAMELGATSIECDMQFTADGDIVMGHNPILNPEITRDAAGNYVPANKYDIRKMTVEEIQKYNVSKINPTTEYYKLHGTSQVVPEFAQIPTLRQLLQLIKDSGNKNVFINIEVKSYPDPLAGQAYENNADKKKFLKKSENAFPFLRKKQRHYIIGIA